MNKQGLLLCAKYSVAPNFFGYCGPDENSSLVDHLKEKVGDKEVQSILSEFETLYINLTLIAKENKIVDIFDKRVVEAYWVGNVLLKNVSSRDYAQLLDEKFNLEKKLGSKNLSKLSHKIQTHTIYPHHSFHVFNIFKRTGHDPSFHTLDTMDECRISFGQIKGQNSPLRQGYEGQAKLQNEIVEVKPLIVTNNKLQFGRPIERSIKTEYKGKTFLKNLKVGDWVSFHWGHVCDILTQSQAKNLEFYTQKAIDFYNS